MTAISTEIRISPAGEGPGEKSLKVEIPVERVSEAEKKATSVLARRVRLPGFRAGKAPVEVIRKRFKDAIKEQLLRELIDESWKAALEQQNLKPIADPHIHHLKFDDGQPITFEFHIEVKPDLNLGTLGGFTLNRQATKITDDIVDQQVDAMRKQKAPWAPVTEGRPANDDMVQVTLATLEDGEAKDPKPYQIVLGEGRAIPDLEDRIMAMGPGETTDTQVRFPDDFPDETKRGQNRGVRLTLHEVKRRALQELNDDFAREMGDFESIADLKKVVRQDLELESAREADAGIRRQVIDQVVAANGVTAPRPLVERVLRAYVQAYEVPEDRLDQFAQEFGPVAEAQVKRDLVLDYVAEKENLRATEQEMDERVADLAARRKMETGQLYAQLQKANRLNELKRTITEEKIFAHLLSLSTVTDT